MLDFWENFLQWSQKTEEKFLVSLTPVAFLDLFFDSCHLTHWCFVNFHKM